jgi:hypothetical protein
MQYRFRFGDLVTAFISGIALALLVSLTWSGNTTVIQEHIVAAPAKVTAPAKPTKAAAPSVSNNVPAFTPPVATTLDACSLIYMGYTSTTSAPVALSPDSAPSGDGTDCAFTDSGLHYSVSLYVEPDATYSDYLSYMQTDSSMLPGTSTQGQVWPISYLATGVTVAFSVSGVYTDGWPFENINFLMESGSGTSYLVTVDVARDAESTPALNASALAASVSSLLP